MRVIIAGGGIVGLTTGIAFKSIGWEVLVSDRSRLLHGTLSTLAADMRASRSSLTLLAHELLLNFSLELDQYEASGENEDDIGPFLDWVATRRGS